MEPKKLQEVSEPHVKLGIVAILQEVLFILKPKRLPVVLSSSS